MGKRTGIGYNPSMQPESNGALNGRYRLIERAGSGGMATVYKAQDLMLGRVVAVKVLHESLTGDEAFLRRFQKEAHAAASLAHPNIVTVHDIGQDDRRYYIVMEYVHGATLKELIRQQAERRDRPLSVGASLDLAIQICAGIGYAHRAGLVHCDVKSQNVLVTRDRIVKVADFGIARALSEASVHDDSLVWGTPQYFSPEQAAGRSATPASDVYSIGVILFEMLAGRLPFEADSPTAMALKHIQETPPPVTTYNPLVPAQLERIIMKVMSKEPASRYRTADQLGRVLSAYRESSISDTGFIPATDEAMPVAEQETRYYPAPVPAATRVSSANYETQVADYLEPTYGTSRDYHLTVSKPKSGLDWTAIVLGILALLSLLGLIPLWYLVYLRYTG